MRGYQLWGIEPAESPGLYYIRSHRGKYLEDRPTLMGGNQVGVHSDRRGYQKWSINDVPSSPGSYHLINHHSGLKLQNSHSLFGGASAVSMASDGDFAGDVCWTISAHGAGYDGLAVNGSQMAI